MGHVEGRDLSKSLGPVASNRVLPSIGLVLPLLLAPAFLFPQTEWLLLGLIVPAFWLLNLRITGEKPPHSPLSYPLAGILTMVLVSSLITFDLAFSLPKISGTLLGVFVFLGILNWAYEPVRIRYLIRACAVGGILLGCVDLTLSQLPGVLGLDEMAFSIEPLLNPNAVAGTAILLLPLTTVHAYQAGAARQKGQPRWGIETALFVSASLLLAGSVLLSWSLGAWIGIVAATFFVLAARRWKPHWLLWIAVTLLFFVSIVTATIYVRHLAESRRIHVAPFGAGARAVVRSYLWERGLASVQDFPWTGSGMNNFRRTQPLMYPMFTTAGGQDLASAHNIVLQTAADLGIPGLIALLAMWTAVTRMLWQVWSRTTQESTRVTVVAILAGLAAHFVYQTADSVPLGAKLGIFWWLLVSLAAALFRLHASTSNDTTRFNITASELLLYWALGCFSAVLMSSSYPALALCLASLSGLLLGYLSVDSYRMSLHPANALNA